MRGPPGAVGYRDPEGGQRAQEDAVDHDQARARLRAERAEIEDSLAATESAVRQDQTAEQEVGDAADVAQPLAAEGTDEAIAESLRGRLGAIDRALQRLEDGTYGRSIRSGRPIPEERLEADPAAELTVEEAAQSS
jgi:DnaK suppressor protein